MLNLLSGLGACSARSSEPTPDHGAGSEQTETSRSCLKVNGSWDLIGSQLMYWDLVRAELEGFWTGLDNKVSRQI